jgi:formylglycine-generating enzyme required for sulfatase activity
MGWGYQNTQKMLSILLLFASAAQAQEWRPDYSLRPRPDGPGVSSLAPGGPPELSLVDGPAASAQRGAWLQALIDWREARKREISYHDDIYRRSDLAWTRHIFTQDQMLIWDRSLYDPVARVYTVDRALAAVERRFGPLDSVLLWPGYPNLGLDERNQFDLIRDLPGGVPELRRLVDSLHRHGVKVFFPVVVWDEGTRSSPVSRAAEADRLLRDINADGINLDTLDRTPEDALALALGHAPPMALEPQFSPQNDSLSGSPISWNDWVLWDDQSYPFEPRVSRVKWLEPRHMVEVTDRYARVKTNSLQQAFFNGQGYALIENMWGFWNGFSPRDAESIRRFTRIERAYAELLASVDWQPYAPTLQRGVFASRFPGHGLTLWTIVNRNDYRVDGEQLEIPTGQGVRYYDLWNGREVRPSQDRLAFAVEPLGYGAVLAVDPGADAGGLAIQMIAAQQDAATELTSFSPAITFAQQAMTEIDPTRPAAIAPPGMIRIPAALYDFRVDGIEVENGNDPGVDVQFPWESSPRRYHRSTLRMPDFFIDRTPVTNAEFKRFLDASAYRPADPHNFLKDWNDDDFPEGWGSKPVTWVSIEDARAYAAWAGKRLPHGWEWQYAAQGTDGRRYPWGNDWRIDAVPAKERGRTRPPPPDAGQHPSGASPFGVMDMVGTVEQWTDEFSDEHTRAAILRGGDYYRPQGSLWYFPKSDRLDEQEKYLLIGPARDRSGVVGFRCVKDAAS